MSDSANVNKCTRCYWVDPLRSDNHPNSVFVGIDKDGGELFVGRATHEGNLLPAKVAPTHQGAFVAYGGLEHSKFYFEYELLIVENGIPRWESASNGAIPARAFPIGRSVDGEEIFVARVHHDGTVTPGKLLASQGTCNITYDGVELAFSEYEVMVM